MTTRNLKHVCGDSKWTCFYDRALPGRKGVKALRFLIELIEEERAHEVLRHFPYKVDLGAAAVLGS
jgi:hypothetical protein